MIGTWLGYYQYGNENIKKNIGFDKTYFTITINSFDEKHFKGIVIDDTKSGGMNGTGNIIGKIENDVISFKKLMPVRSLIYPSGKQIDLNKKHPTLYYTGRFTNNKTEINGEWKFKIKVGLLFGFIPMPYRPGRGTWSMTLQ